MATVSNAQLNGTSSDTPLVEANDEAMTSGFIKISKQVNEVTDNHTGVNGVDPLAGHTPRAQEIDQSSRLETVDSYPISDLNLEDRCIDEFRPLRVAVIGAGLSGILSGILLPLKVPNIQLTIFEKNKEVVSL